MTDWKELAARLSMSHRPLAIAFLEKPPAGVPKFSGSEPAGCSFWGLAAAATLPLEGRPSCMALPSGDATRRWLQSRLHRQPCVHRPGEDELYIVVAGEKLAAVAEALGVIATANAALEEYARSRHVSLSTA